MEFSFNQEEVVIKTKQGTRTFRLEEHSNEAFDQYLEQNAILFDRAISKLRDVDRKKSAADPDELEAIRMEVTNKSAEMVAQLLIPVDPQTPIDAAWARQNLSWRMREAIINKQNDLDGVEVVKDQSFLVTRALATNIYSIRMQMNRIQVEPETSSQMQADLDSNSMTDTKSNSTIESESSQASPPETAEQQEHVSIDDLEIDGDGFALA